MVITGINNRRKRKMNVFTPRKCRLQGGLRCVYDLMRRNHTGELVSHGCSIKSGDLYRIFPEHTAQGDVINNDDSVQAEDLKLGPTIIWENITNMHQDGMSFDLRTFHADIHPLYHKEHRNVPISISKENELVGEVFGGDSPVLVSTGWIDISFYGHDRVERCREGIYGPFDFRANTTRPKCFKSYTLIVSDWINFTTQIDYWKRKEFFALDESKESVKEFCYSWFKEKVAKRVAKGIECIRNGDYINIQIILKNNFVDEKVISEFRDKVSLKSKKQLYSSNLNLQSYFRLYDQIDKMKWKMHFVDANGKEVVKEVGFPAEIVELYKQNIVNFVLNYPVLQKTKVNLEDSYRTNERYWWAMLLFKRAMKDGIINKKMPLPQWLVSQYRSTGKHDPIVTVFGDSKPYSQCSQQEKDNFLESKIVRVENAKDLYPAMERIEDIIDYHKKGPMWYTFCDILKAGRKWNRSEIQSAWDVFKRAWKRDDPYTFWDWVEEMSARPFEDDLSVDGREVMFEGACKISYGDGDVTPSRSFASNLIGLRAGCEEDSFEINKMPPQDWYEASGRSKVLSKDPKQVFWDQLAKTGGILIEDKYVRDHIMERDAYNEATDRLSDKIMYECRSLSMPSEISKAEYSSMCIYDVDTDELLPMREESEWQDEG